MTNEIDPADGLREAQRRHRRRMLVVLALAGAAAALFVVLLVMFTRGGRSLPPISKPFLFEVTGPGTTQPSYLFGTMHIAYGVNDLPRAVLAVQDRCGTTVTESDLEARDDEAAPAPTPTDGIPAHSGRRRLDDEEWATLSKMTGLPEDKLESERTSYLLGTALSSVLPKVEAMDRGLQKRAREKGKQLAFLETRRLEQVMSDETPILDGLRSVLQHRGAFRKELFAMARTYAAGGEHACEGPLGELKSDLNDTWAGTIEEHVRRGDTFIAIGCSHLVGEASIVERLRARGYTVTRVK